MESPINIDDLGVPLFQETTIWVVIGCYYVANCKLFDDVNWVWITLALVFLLHEEEVQVWNKSGGHIMFHCSEMRATFGSTCGVNLQFFTTCLTPIANLCGTT